MYAEPCNLNEFKDDLYKAFEGLSEKYGIILTASHIEYDRTSFEFSVKGETRDTQKHIYKFSVFINNTRCKGPYYVEAKDLSDATDKAQSSLNRRWANTFPEFSVDIQIKFEKALKEREYYEEVQKLRQSVS